VLLITDEGTICYSRQSVGEVVDYSGSDRGLLAFFWGLVKQRRRRAIYRHKVISHHRVAKHFAMLFAKPLKDTFSLAVCYIHFFFPSFHSLYVLEFNISLLPGVNPNLIL
jgi:hypothetical protein